MSATTLAEVIFLEAALFFFITYDPPSGYNMGTGDSKIPFFACLILGIICLIMGATS